jgi:hypothetical protein
MGPALADAAFLAGAFLADFLASTRTLMVFLFLVLVG